LAALNRWKRTAPNKRNGKTMALKKCRECGNSVSTRAATCPSCGAPVKKSKTVSTGCGCLLLLLGLVAVAGIRESNRTPEEKAQRAALEKATQEQQAAERAARGEAEKEKREVARKNQKQNLDRFVKRLAAAGIDNSIIRHVSVNGEGDTATITVANTWHLSVKQIRLQSAQNLWKLWAAIASPDDLDKARISLVDINGNEVGGSQAWGGSLIWVQEN
jgi:hypothetical protein